MFERVLNVISVCMCLGRARSELYLSQCVTGIRLTCALRSWVGRAYRNAQSRGGCPAAAS